MTLLFSCFSQEQVVRMGLSPAWFLASSQRASGEPEGGVDTPLPFWYTM